MPSNLAYVSPPGKSLLARSWPENDLALLPERL
jgi:hypothetical protein